MSVQTCVSYLETDPVSTIYVTTVWILELWLNICRTDLTPESNQAILQSKWTFVLGALLIYHNPGRTWPWTLTTKLWLVYPLAPLKVCVKFEDFSWRCSWDSAFRRMSQSLWHNHCVLASRHWSFCLIRASSQRTDRRTVLAQAWTSERMNGSWPVMSVNKD